MLKDKQAKFPLDFMLQVAFTTAPDFGDYDGDGESYSDTKPWEFPKIKEHLHRNTVKGAKSDKRANVVLNDAVQFTYLQRFFRMALNGKLGNDFPIEKMLNLMEELEVLSPAKKYRTLRWNANPMVEIQLRSAMNDENRMYIEELLKIREELGIKKDEEQALKERNMPLPSL